MAFGPVRFAVQSIVRLHVKITVLYYILKRICPPGDQIASLFDWHVFYGYLWMSRILIQTSLSASPLTLP